MSIRTSSGQTRVSPNIEKIFFFRFTYIYVLAVGLVGRRARVHISVLNMEANL